MMAMFTSISIILKKDFKYIQTVVKSFESIRNHPSPLLYTNYGYCLTKLGVCECHAYKVITVLEDSSMGCLLAKSVYFETVIHHTDNDVLEDICDIGSDDDIDDSDGGDGDNWSIRAVYGSVEDDVGMIKFIYLSRYN
jgi:hypothetical protein